MALNNFPAALQPIIQQGYLERTIMEPLYAQRAYRDIADREPFTRGVGETITKTRHGLLPPVTTPASTTANTDLDNGMTSQYWGVEQYTMSLNQYKATTDLNLINDPVGIVGKFLINARVMGDQAVRSIETLARQALYNTQLGMNTRVTTTLGSAGTTVAVDDIRGFANSWTSANVPTGVSGANPLAVTFIRSGAYSSGANSANTTGGTYNCTGVTADGSNTSSAIAVGGISGTLTFGSNVAIADATLGNGVVASVAPIIKRPFQRATSAQLGSGDVLTTQLLLNAKQTMKANGIPPFANGNYRLFVDNFAVLPLYADPAFQRFTETHMESMEYRAGRIGSLMGVDIYENNMTPQTTGTGGVTISRSMLVGQGALIESDFTSVGYDNVRNVLNEEAMIVIDGVAFITRPPLDRLGQVITQSWTYIGGFTSPTDITTNTTVFPSASNSAYKRAVCIETTLA